MDANHDPWGGTSTLTPDTDLADRYKPIPGSKRAGRAAASFSRGFLLFLLALVAPLALIVWAAMPRLTSPTQIADQAIEVGLAGAVREAFVDELSSQLAERRASPTESPQMRSIFERSLSQDWFDTQVRGVTASLETWLAGSDQRPPHLVVDLTPVKASLAADPEALFLVAGMVGADELEGSVAAALAGVPDEVELLSDTAVPGEPAALFSARDYLESARTLRKWIPFVVLAMFAITVVLSREGERLGGAGRTLVVVGVPLLVAAFVMPVLASELAAGAIPSEIPLDGADVADLLSWMLEPVRPVGAALVAVGLAAIVASFAMGAIGRRQTS